MPPATDSTPTPLLRADRLTKTVKSGDAPLTILDGVTFDIAPGESVAIVGASGSGKTTLLGLLAGLDRPSEGEVWVGGHALSGLDEDARAALRQRLLGFVFQSFQLLPALTALENVMLPLELAGAGDPKLLMADEPTGNLDGATGAEIADLMFSLNRERGTTLVLVTHDDALASRCTRRLSLASGRLVADEAPN